MPFIIRIMLFLLCSKEYSLQAAEDSMFRDHLRYYQLLIGLIKTIVQLQYTLEVGKPLLSFILK